MKLFVSVCFLVCLKAVILCACLFRFFLFAWRTRFFFKVVLFTNTTNAGPSGLNRFKFTLYIGYDEQSQEEKHTLKKKRF